MIATETKKTRTHRRASRATLFGAAVLGALFTIAPTSVAHAQPGDFMDLIRNGKYKELAEKLRANVDLSRADPALRKYLEKNIEYLERGAPPPRDGQEIILIRGGGNDRPYKANPASGGQWTLLPNTIRYQRRAWDARLARINAYFSEATTQMGGDGNARHQLERIMQHHKGGGLGTNANSVKSVLISASTQPIAHFGPPYYILRVPKWRAIFNYVGLSGEREVLLPFWVLPHEIVDKVETLEEVKNHELYKKSKFKDILPQSGGKDNWKIIEQNIRRNRRPLSGIGGLDLALPPGADAGRSVSELEMRQFEDRIARRGAVVERAAPGDLRLGEGVLGRTFIEDGRIKVLLPSGPVKQVALIEELTHVIQLDQEARRRGGLEAVESLLEKAGSGDRAAERIATEWELRARRFVRGALRGTPAEAGIVATIGALEAELRGGAPVGDLARMSIPELVRRLRQNGIQVSASELTNKSALIQKLSGADRVAVESTIASARAESARSRPSTGRVRGTTVVDQVSRERGASAGFIDRIVQRTRGRERARR